MNFFEHQDQARRNTTRLLLLFGLSIAVMILAFYGVAIALLATEAPGPVMLWRPGVLFWVASGTVVFMAVGSSTKMAQLSQGGHSVARGLGGRQLDPLTTDPSEQRLVNVVSEMALASGTPIPAIYLLDDELGINAFAAGFTPDNAVIGVTRGCLEQLSRDELQGVIGHEFSHILNGDMGLNLKLIGVIHGLLLIYIAGRVILRTSYYSDGALRRSKDDKGGGAILAAALAMLVIGYLGVLGGRLIKSAVSREREFLADAAAVQYTRNPEGIAGALRKIGQLSAGSAVTSPMAETASHLFFGEANGTLSFLGGWFATHPPLGERLRRLGQVPVAAGGALVGSLVESLSTSPTATEDSLVMGFQGRTKTAVGQEGGAIAPPSAGQFVTALGTTDARRLTQVRSLLAQLPDEVKAALQDPTEAANLVYALLVRTRPALQTQQIEYLSTACPDCKQRVGQLYKSIRSLEPGQDLLLLEALIPALKQLDPEAGQRFMQLAKSLSQPGGRLLLSNYPLQLILRKRLSDSAQPAGTTADTLSDRWGDAVNLLALLARAGHTRPEDALYALKLGLSQLPGAQKQPSPNQLPSLSSADINTSLNRLETLSPKLKQAVVDACAHTVLADNDVTPAEMGLLRAVVITLDCPAPPFLK
ncbi:hypothetical protein C8255_21300 [filamentous cyanobacterium CCP3]|nr:hypothetical protein C8255_21300 [filamentous cyanobacterium CCP3]